MEEGHQILIIAWDKIFVKMMEESNEVFLTGVDALVNLAEPMHKEYSTTFVLGYLFSRYVSYD